MTRMPATGAGMAEIQMLADAFVQRAGLSEATAGTQRRVAASSAS